MQTITTLINDELFKQYSPITENTDLTEFIPYLSIVQELYITPILGERLIAELIEQISNNLLTEKNSNLILKIAPAISFLAVYQGLPFHWASIVNKGITIRESENSKATDIKDLAQLRQWIRNDADIFIKLLIDFLCLKENEYPLWKPDKDYCSSCTVKENIFDSGFYFPKK